MQTVKKLFIGVIIVGLLSFPFQASAEGEELVPYEYYYEQLSADEKMLYREMLALYYDRFGITRIVEFEEFDYVFIYDKADFAETVDYDALVYEIEEIQAAQRGILDALHIAHIALQLDHPELFGKNCSAYFWYDFDLEKEKTFDVFLNFVIQLEPMEGYGDYSEEYFQVLAKIRQIDVSGTRMEKLKMIHNYLIVNAVYEENESRCFFAVGAFLDEKCVCQGYAMAFKMACDYYGIPCICVGGHSIQDQEGETHMWNYVQMPDQKWYAVDVTWDDVEQPSVFYYDYFLTGSAVRDEHFGGYLFGESHRADSGIFEDEKRFVYPALAEAAYVPAENEPIETGPAPWITPSPPPTAVPTPLPVPSSTAAFATVSPALPEEDLAETEERKYTAILFLLLGVSVFAVAEGVFIAVKKKKR